MLTFFILIPAIIVAVSVLLMVLVCHFHAEMDMFWNIAMRVLALFAWIGIFALMVVFATLGAF